RDVSHRHAARRDAALRAVMRVAVQREVAAPLVDGLAEQVRAQERVDLELLAERRVLRRRVVRQRHAHVALERLQPMQQPARLLRRVGDEGLHLALAQLRAAGAREAAAEPYHAGYP